MLQCTCLKLHNFEEKKKFHNTKHHLQMFSFKINACCTFRNPTPFWGLGMNINDNIMSLSKVPYAAGILVFKKQHYNF